MARRSKSRVRLGNRDRDILRYIGEHRMSWLEPLQCRFYHDRQRDAVKSTLRRLTGHPPRYRYLQPELLDGKRKYLRLTSSAARMLGFPESVARPLGRNALIGRYGLQWFIEVDGTGKRWLCSRGDLNELTDDHRQEDHQSPR